MKFNVVSALTALVVSTFATAVVAAATPESAASTVGGQVVDSINQHPLGGVEVDVFDDSQGSHTNKPIATTTTNKDGNFSLLGLRSGTYHLEFAKRGYALEIVTGLLLRADERILIAQPFGMRSAVVTTNLGQAMETHL